MCAVGKGHKDIVKLLLSKNTNINPRDQSGQVPLSYAAMRGDIQTSLSHAAKGGHGAVVKLLLGKGSFLVIEPKSVHASRSVHIPPGHTGIDGRKSFNPDIEPFTLLQVAGFECNRHSVAHSIGTKHPMAIILDRFADLIYIVGKVSTMATRNVCGIEDRVNDDLVRIVGTKCAGNRWVRVGIDNGIEKIVRC